MSNPIENKSTKAGSSTNENAPSVSDHRNPFETPFDDGEGDDEWWEDDRSVETPQAASNSRVTRWPRLDSHGPESSLKSPQGLGIHKVDKRYSVRKPVRDKSSGRQKKQNALAGIKLITDFSPRPEIPKEAQAPPSPPRQNGQQGCFVNLAALQALDGQPNQPSSSWWSKKGPTAQAGTVNASDKLPSTMSNNKVLPKFGLPSVLIRKASKAKGKVPAPLELETDLSPNDRPIVIGISIPSARFFEHSPRPSTTASTSSYVLQKVEPSMTAASGPQTPTIVVTPAHDASAWSPDTPSTWGTHSRAASSIYSSFNPTMGLSDEVPPVPVIPQLPGITQPLQDVNSHRESPDTSPIHPQKEQQDRVMSSHTVFEEDESPTAAYKQAFSPVSSKSIRSRSGSNSTNATRRRSKGWWTYILTPWMNPSSKFATTSKEDQQESQPPLPKLAAAFPQGLHPDDRTKALPSFSPQSATTASSDHWWTSENEHAKDGRSSLEGDPDIQFVPKHKVQRSSGTLPLILSSAGEEGIVGHGSTCSEDSFSRASPDNIHRQASVRSAVSPDDRTVPIVLQRNLTNHGRPNAFVHQEDLRGLSSQEVSQVAPREETERRRIATGVSRPLSSTSPQPPPYSPPRAQIPKYRAIYPPDGQQSNPMPPSPTPLSPGLQQAMGSRDAIPLSDVPLTPAAPRPIVLNSSYRAASSRQDNSYAAAIYFDPPPKKAQKAEKQRRKYEKEDAMAHRAGGLWRGRGCIPKRGCYGRQGAEGRKRRRCWFGILAFLLSMVILIVVLATTLHRSHPQGLQESQWLNLTGFPPIFTGISTIATPTNLVENTGCVFPSTLWSCSLPKELQSSVSPNAANQPNFRLQIQWDNSTAANATFANIIGNPELTTRATTGNVAFASHIIRRLLQARQALTYDPSPVTPTLAEQFFLGNTTDDVVSSEKAGEATPFYISFLSPTTVVTLAKRAATNTSSSFPDLSSLIPAPSSNDNGTAAPANLLPTPTQQPIRLYDRGLVTEHYGFYTYYDRSIFLKSTALLTGNNTDGEVPDDEDGGATEAEAKVRCTWSQTRFLVQIWTRMNTTAALLNATSTTSSENLNTSISASANDFIQPGSFPYPVTITTDRHGGNSTEKMIYCYALDDREQQTAGTGKLALENRGFGGTLVNPAPSLFGNSSDAALGGFDGGTGGCECQWANWQKTSN
jgi:hypothetical protein